MKIPTCTLGFNIPGTAFTLSTGWGLGHPPRPTTLKMAKELMETGSVASANFAFPEKYGLLDQPFYDELIKEWADKTGRLSRPNHAP